MHYAREGSHNGFVHTVGHEDMSRTTKRTVFVRQSATVEWRDCIFIRINANNGAQADLYALIYMDAHIIPINASDISSIKLLE